MRKHVPCTISELMYSYLRDMFVQEDGRYTNEFSIKTRIIMLEIANQTTY